MYQHSNRRLIAALAATGLVLAGCGTAATFDDEAASDEGPSKVEPVKGTPYARVTLTEQAARRVGIRTARIRPDGRRTVMPFDAVVYDAEGHAFAFTSPRPLVYVRRPVRILRIDGTRAVLAKGPPAGTPVVTVGAAELLGVEYGVEED